MLKFRIDVEGKKTIHVSVDESHCLCGLAIDGDPPEQEPGIETNDRINCPKCIEFIKTIKSIKLNID